MRQADRRPGVPNVDSAVCPPPWLIPKSAEPAPKMRKRPQLREVLPICLAMPFPPLTLFAANRPNTPTGGGIQLISPSQRERLHADLMQALRLAGTDMPKVPMEATVSVLLGSVSIVGPKARAPPALRQPCTQGRGWGGNWPRSINTLKCVAMHLEFHCPAVWYFFRWWATPEGAYGGTLFAAGTGSRSQKSEVRSQRSEIRNQRSEVREQDQKSQIGGPQRGESIPSDFC